MIISFIVAADEQNGMGKDNHLPWHLPADFKMFKETTKGHHILMGRKTYESLKGALPQRTNIVISSQPDFKAEGAVIKHSIEEGVKLAFENGETELFIIGGAKVFAQAFPQVARLYLTRVHAIFDADTFMPEFDKAEWKTVKSEFHAPDEKNKWPFTFLVMERIS
jgi:dihydrofolate reductase